MDGESNGNAEDFRRKCSRSQDTDSQGNRDSSRDRDRQNSQDRDTSVANESQSMPPPNALVQNGPPAKNYYVIDANVVNRMFPDLSKVLKLSQTNALPLPLQDEAMGTADVTPMADLVLTDGASDDDPETTHDGGCSLVGEQAFRSRTSSPRAERFGGRSSMNFEHASRSSDHRSTPKSREEYGRGPRSTSRDGPRSASSRDSSRTSSFREDARPRSLREDVRPGSSREFSRHDSSREDVRPGSSREFSRHDSSREDVRPGSSREFFRHDSSREDVRPGPSREEARPSTSGSCSSKKRSRATADFSSDSDISPATSNGKRKSKGFNHKDLMNQMKAFFANINLKKSKKNTVTSDSSSDGATAENDDDEEDLTDDQNSSNTCSVCSKRRRSHIFTCKHSFCEKCIVRMKNQKLGCPKCGLRFRSWTKLHFND